MRGKSLDFTRAIEICKVAEQTQQHLRDIPEGEARKVEIEEIISTGNYSSRNLQSSGNYRQGSAGRNLRNSQTSRNSAPTGNRNFRQANCGRCGGQHQQGRCPAYGKVSRRCKKVNYFVLMCRSK